MGRMFDAARVETELPAPAPRIDPDGYIPALLAGLSHSLILKGAAFYRETFGIGLTDVRILYRLAIEPWVSAHHLSKTIGLDKSVVSRSIAYLEERSLITLREDSADARRRLIALTPVGNALHDRIAAAALRREENLLKCLSEAELAAFRATLAKLTANLDAFAAPERG